MSRPFREPDPAVVPKIPMLHLLNDLSNADFIRHIYRILLRRTVDREGLAHYVGQLADGRSRGALIAELRGSSEGHKANPAGQFSVAMLAELLCPGISTEMEGLIAAEAEPSGLEVLWGRLEGMVAAGLDLQDIVGRRVGWLSGLSGEFITGLVFSDTPKRVSISVNTQQVGTVTADAPVMALQRLGVAANRFKLPLSQARIPDTDLAHITASVGDAPLDPGEQIVCPWLTDMTQRLDAYTHVAGFDILNTTAFRT